MVGPVPVPSRVAASALSFVLLLVAGCSRERRDIPGTEKKLYSQFDEELVIRDFFQDRRGGFFVDVGASAPVEHSITHYLEKDLGWSDLLSRDGPRALLGGEGPRVQRRDALLRAVEVETVTLDKVLDDRRIEKIDLLSIDIEESEPPALARFDIERFRPELVCEASPSIQEAILAYFHAHGYERIDRYLAADSVNWYFEPRS
ncbi:MAG TPA: FkbM family methyltransferase [Myxococcota bacterium]|nr:FkbM family methyltransferase [Myxococcota bacterium]